MALDAVLTLVVQPAKLDPGLIVPPGGVALQR
jgi:hypothetical protein